MFKQRLFLCLQFASVAICSLQSSYMSHSTLIMLSYTYTEEYLLPGLFYWPWLVLLSSGPVSFGYNRHDMLVCFVSKRERDHRRKNVTSLSLFSLCCCFFYPLLFAADVRTTFSPITSKGTSCIWTIRWGNAWMHGPVSSSHELSSCNALLYYINQYCLLKNPLISCLKPS